MYVSADCKGATFSPLREHALLPASSGLSFVLFSPKWFSSCNCFLACCMLQVDSAVEKKEKVEGSSRCFHPRRKTIEMSIIMERRYHD